jgi:tripartite-type tricarboxylate transporter receptor subunit TctC
MLPHIRQGKLKALAVASRARIAALPDVPTVGEAGYGDFEAGSWVGFFAPAKASPEIVGKLNAALNEALSMPDVRERFAALSVEASTGTPAEIAAAFTRQVENWARMVKTTGITAE